MKRKFDVIGAPFNQLGFVTTDDNTVEALRKTDEQSGTGLTDWIWVRNARWGADITDVGDVSVSEQVTDFLGSEQKDAALASYASALKERLLESYISGRIPLTIGGDHSVAVGTLQAVKQFHKHKKVAIIWADAHADCNNTQDSNLHGKPLALLMNQYPFHNWHFDEDTTVQPSDIYYIGVRDLMPCEHRLVNELGISSLGMSDIEEQGFSPALKSLMEHLEQEYDAVYLSFDYDVLDGSLFRACATPDVGGLSAREALHLVYTVAQSEKFIGAEFVEYLPEKDTNGVSRELMIKLIDAVWGYRC